MTDWITCPNCGAVMTGFTGGYSCPLCGYRVPVQTYTATTGTGRWYIDNEKPKPNKDIVEVIRCKECKWYMPTDEEGGWCRFSQHGYPKPYDYCSDAERKEE